MEKAKGGRAAAAAQEGADANAQGSTSGSTPQAHDQQLSGGSILISYKLEDFCKILDEFLSSKLHPHPTICTHASHISIISEQSFYVGILLLIRLLISLSCLSGRGTTIFKAFLLFLCIPKIRFQLRCAAACYIEIRF